MFFLHGLARSQRSLRKLRRRVERAGYPTWARSYPSRRQTLDELAQTVAGWIRESVGEGPLIAVTHSMGGILVRHMRAMLGWRGAVMIAPPNNGSHMAAKAADYSLYRWFYGPSGQQIAAPGNWPQPPDPFAVIAGTRGLAISNPTSWVTRAIQGF